MNEAPRPRKARYAVEVSHVRHLTPRMVRVTFTGDALAAFAWNGPAAHIKLIFEGDDAAASAGPREPAPRPVMRTYTPRRFDAQARELVVDMVIHGAGPASAWASRASVGQRLTIAGPGRNYQVDGAADWYLLAGDDTAIPAIGTILEALPPKVRALVLLEVVDASEEHPIDARGDATQVHWLHRGPDPAGAGQPLEAAVRRIELPSGTGAVYVACESEAMRRIRRHLLHERQLPRTQLVTRGYWRLGETDHPDRDYGEDVG